VYSVSNLGRIRGERAYKAYRPGRIIEGTLSSRGYRQVMLSDKARRATRNVHRLVAAAFLGPCPVNREINHKNGIKTDARLENLEYTTHAYNRLHSCRVLGGGCGERNGAAKLTQNAVDAIRRHYVRGKITLVFLGKKYGVSHEAIHHIVSNRNWVKREMPT
jgi:hypothetical protein